MKIYHGSKTIIKEPIYGVGNRHNDYGLGFYCTDSLELAKEWACASSETNGFANKYELDLKKCRVLDLREYSILNWMGILLKNRTFDTGNPTAQLAKEYLLENFYIDTEDYDVIIGYRADDSYFSFARDFINNTIFVGQLARAMQLGELGVQIVLTSEKAFGLIEYIGYEEAQSSEYYVKRVSRDKKAREDYKIGCRNGGSLENSTFVMDIIRRGLKNGDKIL